MFDSTKVELALVAFIVLSAVASLMAVIFLQGAGKSNRLNKSLGKIFRLLIMQLLGSLVFYCILSVISFLGNYSQISYQTFFYVIAVVVAILFIFVIFLLEVIVSLHYDRKIFRRQRDMFLLITHELKTPMSMLRMRSDQLLRNSSMASADLQNEVKLMQDEIIKMNQRLAEVLTYSRLSNSKVLERTEFMLDEMVEDLAMDYLVLAEDKNVALTIDLPEESAVIFADQVLLRTAVSNYLSNAVKFTPDGGEITLRLCKEKDIRIEVRNTGTFIFPQDIQRIWGEFIRVDQPYSSVNDTGLGLPIVQRIVDLHNGICGTFSDSRGTVFWIELGG